MGTGCPTVSCTGFARRLVNDVLALERRWRGRATGNSHWGCYEPGIRGIGESVDAETYEENNERRKGRARRVEKGVGGAVRGSVCRSVEAQDLLGCIGRIV